MAVAKKRDGKATADPAKARQTVWLHPDNDIEADPDQPRTGVEWLISQDTRRKRRKRRSGDWRHRFLIFVENFLENFSNKNQSAEPAGATNWPVADQLARYLEEFAGAEGSGDLNVGFFYIWRKLEPEQRAKFLHAMRVVHERSGAGLTFEQYCSMLVARSFRRKTMDHEQLMKRLRERLMEDRMLRDACAKIGERFSQWPVLRKDLANAIAGVVNEEHSDVRWETGELVDRLVREGFFREHPGGAFLHPAVPLDQLLDRKRKPPEPVVITFRAEVSEPPAPMTEPAASNSDDPDNEEQGIELSLEKAVLIGLYTVNLERHHGWFSRGTVVADLQRLFRDWHLPTHLHGARGIRGVIVRYLQEEILEIVDEAGETYRLTERGLTDGKAAKSAWDDQH